MSDEPLNDLERVLLELWTDIDNNALKSRLVATLLDSDLYYSPHGDPPADGSLGPIVSAQAEGDAEPAAALFTARERLVQVLGTQARVASMNGYQIMRKLRGFSVRLNPNLTFSMDWKPKDVEIIINAAGMRFS